MGTHPVPGPHSSIVHVLYWSLRDGCAAHTTGNSTGSAAATGRGAQGGQSGAVGEADEGIGVAEGVW